MMAPTPITRLVTFVAPLVLSDDWHLSESQGAHGSYCWLFAGRRVKSVRGSWEDPVGERRVRHGQDMHCICCVS
jgi:hypothetical protein